MSGYSQTSLVLTEQPQTQAQAGMVGLFEHLIQHHGLDPDLDDKVGRLIFDPDSLEWIETQDVAVNGRSLQEIMAAEKWICLLLDIYVGDHLHDAEIYYYPVALHGERAGITIRLGSSVYAAVYGGRPRFYGLFDAEMRQALIGLVIGVANAASVDGVLFDFEPEQLLRLTSEELRQRFLKPELTLNGKGPGLITAIKASIVPRDALESVWGSEIQETTTGYCYLALMGQDEAPDPEAVASLSEEE